MRAWKSRLVLAAFLLPTLLGCDDSSDDGPSAGGSSGVGGSGGKASGGTDSGGNNSGGSGGGGAGGQGGAAGQGGSAGDPWASCPTAADYVGEPSWPHTLEVTEEAVYCATFDETRTLKQELAAKAQLRVAPGSYRLPAQAETGLGLPTCLRLGESVPAVAVAPESVRYTSSSFDTTTSHQYFFDQRAPAPERRLTIGLHVALPSSETPAFRLDGSAGDPFNEAQASGSFLLCQTLDESCTVERLFDSCSHSSSTLNRHDVVLDSGSVSLEVRIGESFAGTEPGAFVRASGTFLEQSFDQTDYWKLIYRPAHHHFERDFAVLFDEPVDGVCGIEISALEPFDDFTPDRAFTVDCELNQLEPIPVVSHTLTVDP